MSNKAPKQFNWFIKQEEQNDNARFKTEITYNQIKNSFNQFELFDCLLEIIHPEQPNNFFILNKFKQYFHEFLISPKIFLK